MDFNIHLKKFLRLNAYILYQSTVPPAKKKRPEPEILAFSDLFDMLTYEEPYKPRMPIAKVFEVLDSELNRKVSKRLLAAFYKRNLTCLKGQTATRNRP